MLTTKSTMLTGVMVIGMLSVMNMNVFNSNCQLPSLSTQDISEDSAKPQQEEKVQYESEDCTCTIPTKWTGQAGQDRYLFERLFFQQGLCCKGTFVEFGARDGIGHSNTYPFEKFMGWKGLLFEVDPREYPELQRNRQNSIVTNGPVCPSTMSNVTILLSQLSGWTGFEDSFEPARVNKKRDVQNFKCHHLAKELTKHGMKRVDYMTIDTEGSELEIIQDFPWHDFDIRVVQIEQLDERKYPSQAGKAVKITQHMQSVGYKLLSVFPVDKGDTDDLIFTRNIDEVVAMSKHAKDGDWRYARQN